LTTLFLCPELRAVNSTSAFSDKTFLRAVDAPAASFKKFKLLAVCRADALYESEGTGSDQYCRPKLATCCLLLPSEHHYGGLLGNDGRVLGFKNDLQVDGKAHSLTQIAKNSSRFRTVVGRQMVALGSNKEASSFLRIIPSKSCDLQVLMKFESWIPLVSTPFINTR
jgi:hypothetical protein